MGTRKRHVDNHSANSEKPRRRRRRRARRGRQGDAAVDAALAAAVVENSDNESTINADAGSVASSAARAAKAAGARKKASGSNPILVASLLILLIVATGAIYAYNFVDMSEALENLHTRLVSIVAPKPTRQPPQKEQESPPPVNTATPQPAPEPQPPPPSQHPVPSAQSAGSKPTTPSPVETQQQQPVESPTKQASTSKRKASYAKSSITNSYDNKIRSQIDEADELLERGKVEAALASFDTLLTKYSRSPRAHYGRARALDKLAEMKQSNSVLEQSIEEYNKVLDMADIPVDLVMLAGRQCANRQSFRGWGIKAVKTLQKLIRLRPEDPDLHNELGIKYLLVGQVNDARQHFKIVVDSHPDNGVALVHYGFILKTTDNNIPEAITYLQRGLDTGDEGTVDGRFIFHLGDAYYRNGQHNKSYEVYKFGAKKKLFRSYWQRSLYNVDHLTSRPWWTLEQTRISKQLRVLEKNWRTIRDEGLAQLNEVGQFKNEDENLRETGDWKQLTLFSRGKKHKQVCERTPKTCALVEQIPEAAGCRRGQVKFSIMQPGTHVWPHCGPTNCRVRAHLGLVVPPGPRIRVADETRTWQEGKFIVFDDSFEHEVWHDGDKLRIVLIVDLWHPDLTPSERQTLTSI